MSNYHCKKFCGRSADLVCQTCLLYKEISEERLLEALIYRLNLTESHTIALIKGKIKQKQGGNHA